MPRKNFTSSFRIGNYLFVILLNTLLQSASAQTVLTGLTSNGGPDGKGTAFTINTNGSGFSLLQNFADWGKTPDGDLLKGDDGNFYGMTSGGGTYKYGSIFKMSATGQVTVLKQFNYSTDGGYPDGELIKGADGFMYGMTVNGGLNSYGTIFKISSEGVFTVIKNLSYGPDGSNPHGHLTLSADGNFYGITYAGGAYGYGTIFKLTPGGAYTVLHSMNKPTEGGNSYSSLTEGSDGNLYGLTYGGGTYGYGTIFKVTKAGILTVLKHLNYTDGSYPQSDLIQATDGNFYGTCYSGGANGNGTIFKITAAGVFTIIKDLSSGTTGGYPYGALLQNTDGNFYGLTSSGGTNSSGVVYKLTPAGVYTIIHSLQSTTEGSGAKGALVKGNDANLYALTSYGGAYNFGTAFKVTTAGAVTLLATFNGGVLGNEPYESFIKAKDSACYTTTSGGGTYNYGSIVKICGGSTTVLHSFNKSTDGGIPQGSLVQATDGNFYGLTSEGGANGSGTIFKITPAGVFQVLRNLYSSTDGSYAYGSLIQATDGFLYGMCSSGGANGSGTIFKISTSGAFTVVRHLSYSTDGSNPQGSLIQANDGNFYGMTTSGAKIFKLTPAGDFSVLYTFNSSKDGSYPYGSLIQGTDGNLYGTCSDAGANGYGTIFQVSLSGTCKVLKALMSSADGRAPKGTLLQAPDGLLYGTTSIGGTYNTGTIFRISTTGTYTVLRHLNIATDGGNPYGSLILAPVNNLIANAQSVTTSQDKALAVTLTGTGGSQLTYTISSQPKNGILSGTGANRTYTPNPGYSGTDSFAFRVAIGCMASAPAKVSITITATTGVNHAPVLNPVGNKTIKQNKTLKFTATATDPDAGQTLKYSLINAPAGAKINATTGAFTWKPTTAGSYTTTVRVEDNGSPVMYDEETITIKVTAATLTALNNDEKSNNVAALKATPVEVFNVSLYPNPVHSNCTLQLNTDTEKIIVTITDTKGSIIMHKQFQMNGALSVSLDVSQLAASSYFLTVQTAANRQTIQFTKL